MTRLLLDLECAVASLPESLPPVSQRGQRGPACASSPPHHATLSEPASHQAQGPVYCDVLAAGFPTVRLAMQREGRDAVISLVDCRRATTMGSEFPTCAGVDFLSCIQMA